MVVALLTLLFVVGVILLTVGGLAWSVGGLLTALLGVVFIVVPVRAFVKHNSSS